jgi:hypothetical protein
MTLPMYKHPVYTTTLPSTGKQIKFRPFLVKDEKNLLLAQQSEEELNMIDTLKTVISDCILDKDINVDDLAIFDLEYMFTQLRAKSVGEEVELIFTCKNNECKDKTKISFKIEPELIRPEGHSNKIDLFDDVGVVMKYANSSILKDISKLDTSNPDQILDLIVSCIDYIYDAESVYPAKEQKKQDLIKFVEGLPRAPTDKIKKFFETTPRLQQKIEFDCPKCKTHNDYIIEGIDSFF